MRHIKTSLSKAAVYLFIYGAAMAPNTLMAQTNRYGGWHMNNGFMGGYMGGWDMSWLMLVFWIIVLVALVLVVKWLFSMTTRDRSGAAPGSRALEILKERYAKGEIDKTEFEAKKRDLIRS